MMEPTQSAMNILSNGKSHDLGDDVGVPMKSLLEEDQWVFSLYYKHRQMTALCRLHTGNGILTQHVSNSPLVFVY